VCAAIVAALSGYKKTNTKITNAWPSIDCIGIGMAVNYTHYYIFIPVYFNINP